MYSSKRSTVSGIVRLLLRQRRHLGRKVVDERRLDEIVLAERLEDRRGDLSRRPSPARPRRRAARPAPRPPSRDRRSPSPARRCRAAATRRPARASRSDRRRNGGVSEIVCSPNVHLVAARSAFRATSLQHLLGQRHQVVVVGVAPVELEHRELGVVLRRDPLVPEVAVDLEHPLDAADRQPLQIQLRRDAHVQPHVERVVMRDERPRQRAAGDRLHHRRLDLEEPAGDQELADRRDDAAAHLEHAPRVGVDDQIEIALAVADLDVLQPVPLLRQRQQALGEKLERRRPDRELVASWSGTAGPRRRPSRRNRAA